MPTLESAPHSVADPVVGDGRAERVRVLLLTAIGPLVVGYAGVAVTLALITGLATGARFDLTGVLVAAGPAWLAAWHVPLTVTGHELGVLPLTPTVLLVALVARSAAGAARRLGITNPAEVGPVLTAVGATHAVFGALLAVLCSGPSLAASASVAFFACGILATLAAALGLAGRSGLLDLVVSRTAAMTASGLRVGLLALTGLFGVAALVLAVTLAVSFSVTASLFHASAPAFGDGVGVLLLCVGYLPNVLVGTVSFLAGPGFSIGPMLASPLAMHGARLPAVPLLAAVPDRFATWWPVLFVLPAMVGVGVGWICRRLPGELWSRQRAVLAAASLVAVSCLALAVLAGGSFGVGPFDPVTIPAGLLAVAVFGWIAVPGSLVVWFSGQSKTGEAASESVEAANPADDPAEEVADSGVDADVSEFTEVTEDVPEAEPEDAEPDEAELETSAEDFTDEDFIDEDLLDEEFLAEDGPEEDGTGSIESE